MRRCFTDWLLICTISTIWLPASIGIHPKRHSRHKQLEQLYRTHSVLSVGVWGPWSRWSECSRTCGGGVSAQTRDCITNDTNHYKKSELKKRIRRRIADDPSTTINSSSSPENCVGQYKRFQLCNSKPCSNGTAEFRTEQCAAYNTKAFMGRYYRWEPFYHVGHPCQLNCRPKGERFYVTLAQSVIDGTSCHPGDSSSVCVSGTCKIIGCDGVIGSDKRPDQCGVCGGDNSTCRLVSGVFTQPQLPYGYSLVATIPKGACNISIGELQTTKNLIALRTKTGDYLINGNWEKSWSGSYPGAGTVFSYQRDDWSTSKPERVTATGPTDQPIELMLLSRQMNPGVRYEYTLPNDGYQSWKENAVPVARLGLRSGDEHHRHRHKHIGKHRHDELADAAVSQKRRNAKKIPENTNADNVVDSSERRRNRLNLSRDLISPGLRSAYSWQTAGYTECSKTCGTGSQKSILVCVKDSSQVIVGEHHCEDVPKPEVKHVRCNHVPCPPEWVSEWTECSVSCGEGVQKREANCKQVISSSLTVSMPDIACLDRRPEIPTRKCNAGPCNKWRTGQWSPCSVQCGQGTRHRDVVCVSPSGTGITDSLCESGARPAEHETCNMGSCASNVWFYSNWTEQCSVDCGIGIQTRKIYCPNTTSTNQVTSACDLAKKPDSTKSCTGTTACHGKWFTGPWSQCSSTCGAGIQTRETVCLAFARGQHRVAMDIHCHDTPKPNSEQPCYLPLCSSEWYMSDWGECSKSCDGGIQSREVKCLNEHQMPSADCDLKKQPLTQQACNVAKCLSLGVHSANSQGDSGCEDRYRHCHLVVQARLCTYMYYRNVCCNSCYKYR